MNLVLTPLSVGDRLTLTKATERYRKGQVFIAVELQEHGAMPCSEGDAVVRMGPPVFWRAGELSKFRMHYSADAEGLGWLEGQGDIKLEQTYLVPGGACEFELVDDEGEVLGCGPNLREALADASGGSV